MDNTSEMEKKLSYSSVDDKDIFFLINTVRNGIKYKMFRDITKSSHFTINEWSKFLHLTERTFQRYKKEKKTFDSIHSEKILQIILLYKKGVEVFGDNKKFSIWLETNNLVLGNIKPKHLLDNTFGINIVNDELIRIEHGVLA
ncbi:MAG: DUF2384 domain-containing protein [Bacteroidales bacterium]|nr:DUF2384 domain-containing protein [Bacteroidales bacterium]